MSGPMSKPLPSRRARRTTVVITYAVVAAVTALVLAVDAAGMEPLLEGLLFLGLIPLAAGAFVVLKRNVREVAEVPDAKLDERQLADRNRTYKTAYKVVGWLMVLGGAYVLVALTAARFTLPLPSTGVQAHTIFWWTWLLAVSLPSAIMAWKEPDVAEEADQ